MPRDASELTEGTPILRTRLARNWSRPELVARLRAEGERQGAPLMSSNGVLLGMVRRWESGRCLPSESYRLLLTAVYGASRGELGLPDAEQVPSVDPQRWARVFAAHRTWVQRRIYFRVKDWHLAEDLTSETFIKVARDLGRIDPAEDEDVSLRPWIAMHIARVVGDSRQSARLRREGFLEDRIGGDANSRDASVDLTEDTAVGILDC